MKNRSYNGRLQFKSPLGVQIFNLVAEGYNKNAAKYNDYPNLHFVWVRDGVVEARYDFGNMTCQDNSMAAHSIKRYVKHNLNKAHVFWLKNNKD